MARREVGVKTGYVTAIVLALVAGASAYAGAFDARAPAVFLIVPVVALAWSETRHVRILVSLMTHVALWSPLPGMALAYGVSPAEAWAGISAIMTLQAVAVGLLPPALGVVFWAVSPFGFGHPVFGLFSVMPFWWLGPVGGLLTAALILVGFAIRRTFAVAVMCLAVLGTISTFRTDLPKPSALVAVSTAFAARSMFPADDWADIGARLANVEGSGPRLLPEASIGQDIDRGYGFFSELARTRGEYLLVGVSDADGEEVMAFSEDGAVETIYQQLQGVPVINDGLAAPWQFFNRVAVDVQGERVAFAICYEAFLPLTWASALMSRSTTVAVVSNDRWNSVPVTVAQAKIFSFPWPANVVAAANAPEM